MTRPSTRATVIVSMLVVPLAALTLSLIATRNGPLVSPDSAVYLSVAEHIRDGEGLTVGFRGLGNAVPPKEAVALGHRIPLTDYPPLFPTVVAIISRTGLSVAATARGLNCLLFALVLAEVAYLYRLAGGRSVALISAVQVALVIGTYNFSRYPFLLLFSSALSEPLAMACGLGSLLVLLRTRTSASYRSLAAASALASLALLARYAAVGFVLSLAVLVLLDNRWCRLDRVRRAVIALGIGLAPTAMFFLWQRVKLGAVSRTVGWSRPVENLAALAVSLRGFLIGSGHPAALIRGGLLIPIMLTGTWILATSKERLWREKVWPTTMSVFAFVYAAVVVASCLLLDQNVTADGRLLSPLLVVCLPLLAALVSRVHKPQRRRAEAAVLSLCASLVFFLPPGPTVLTSLTKGVSRSTLSPAELSVVTLLPPKDPTRYVFTNAPELVFQLTSRLTFLVPCRESYYSGRSNPDYARDLRAMVDLVRRGEATILLISAATHPFVGSPTEPFGCAGPTDVERFDGMKATTFNQARVYR